MLSHVCMHSVCPRVLSVVSRSLAMPSFVLSTHTHTHTHTHILVFQDQAMTPSFNPHVHIHTAKGAQMAFFYTAGAHIHPHSERTRRALPMMPLAGTRSCHAPWTARYSCTNCPRMPSLHPTALAPTCLMRPRDLRVGLGLVSVQQDCAPCA